MNAKQKRRGTIENRDGGIDGALLASIQNGEDLGPLVRYAFEVEKSDTLTNHLKNIMKQKEVEIEELCKLHYEEFIHAVDELRGVLIDADELKSELSNENLQLQEVASSLLLKLDELLELYTIKKNISEAIRTLKLCMQVLTFCSKCNLCISQGQFIPVLKALTLIERDYLQRLPIKSLSKIIEKQIPVIKSHIEKRVCSEFNDWLVHIRDTAKEIGQSAIGRAASMRQRDLEFQNKQREAEEQSHLGAGECAYTLDIEQVTEGSIVEFDIMPVYRTHHIYGCLGTQDHFCKYYYENRLLQLNLCLEISSQSFLQSYQSFFAQIAGFFIVEERVLRTAGGLLSESQVETIWDVALTRLAAILEEQFSAFGMASHLLLIKDYVTFFAAALESHGYKATPLLNVLDRSRDKYHELLIKELRKEITILLEKDTYEKMVVRKEYEYNTNILSFNLQNPDIRPDFPYTAPFSSAVPDVCRLVRSFTENSVSFLSYRSHISIYDVVRKYLDKFLNDVVNEAILKMIHSGKLGLPQLMQIATNIAALEHAYDQFLHKATQLCGIPVRLVERPHGGLTTRTVLNASQNAAYIELSSLVNSKLDEFMDLANNVNWTADDAPPTENEYMNLVTIFLDTLLSTAQKILPIDVLFNVLSGALEHISSLILTAFLSENLKRFTLSAVMIIDNDLKVLETFADEKSQSMVLTDINKQGSLRDYLSEARQLINLLLSSQPENFMNPVIREKNYGALDYKKVASICEKFKDSPDRIFGSLSTRNSKQNFRKKSMDTLKRRLRDFS